MTSTEKADVEVTISAVDVTALSRGGQVLVAFKDDQDAVHEATRSWAQVRGYDRFAQAVESIFTAAPPESGFLLLIHKPRGLLLFVRWSWCKQPDPWNRDDVGD